MEGRSAGTVAGRLASKTQGEFEYASKNFIRHMHDTDGCDVIVCRVHYWPECRLDVVELRTEVKRLLAAESKWQTGS